MAAFEFGSALGESQTWDEGIHLAAGYTYLTAGDYRLNPEHPALGKMLAALPLLLLHPSLPLDDPSWARNDEVDFGNHFLYTNRVPADTLLLAGRSVIIVSTLLFGLWLALWTRRHFGAPVALLTLTLFVFDPSFLAHGHYITTDLFAALFTFLACTLWIDFVMEGKRSALVFAGLALGAALASKFSTLFLVLVMPVLYCIGWLYERRTGTGPRRLRARHFTVSVLVAGLIAGLVVLVSYAPEVYATLHPDSAPNVGPVFADPLAKHVNQTTLVGKILSFLATTFHLPSYSYALGLNQVALGTAGGRTSYLLGKMSENGFPDYFAVAFAVKTPAAILAVLAITTILVVRLFRRPPSKPFLLIGLALPPAVFFGFSCYSRLNLGQRHILPIYAFLYVLAAFLLLEYGPGLLRRAFPAVTTGLLVLLAAESIWISPHYLAFFNFLAGGPARGPHYLLDSNIDWGQDVKYLKRYMETHQIPSVCIAYFGNANIVYYNIPFTGMPLDGDPQAWQQVDCVAAVSVTPLYGLYVPPERYAYLRRLEPMARIGYSIYLYDLRKRK